ncbi:MAG: glycosyltransferase, partial [Candidatus Gastranaerophilales bacterium]|nr:glycosyltransferase [Candidatus Gastranaerophilales bacterium]
MKISIITASYNYENYIKETIESILAQTYSDWELVIVDDGSKDNSVNLIKTYCEKDRRIKLFTHPNFENKGLKDTLLLGLEKADSEWVVFLESDDSITPDYLEKKVKVIKNNPNVNFIINDVNMFGDLDKKNKLEKKYFKIIRKILKSTNQPVD